MPYILHKYYPWRNIAFAIGEGLLIFLVINCINIYWSGVELFLADLAVYSLRSIIVTSMFQLCLYYFDLYDLSIIPNFADSITRILQAFGFGCIALALLYYLFPGIIISTKVFWSGFLIVCLTISLWRYIYFVILERRMFAQPIALVGSGALAASIVSAIEGKKDSGYKIVALVRRDGGAEDAHAVPVYADVRGLNELCSQRKVEKIVLALDERRGRLPMSDLIDYKFMGVEILDGVGFFEELTGTMPVERVTPSWLLFSGGFRVARLTNLYKRMLDVAVAAAGLIFSLPIFLLSALIIKLESPGPIFYCQERVGLHGKPFKVIKFRSMRADAEKDGPVWASTNDSRVTRFGEFIRKVRIDEIPQMINVLRGDMSFVGPRPERPVFVEQLAQVIPFYALRHVVKPGLTGWAQVYYPYGASEEDALRKLEYDLYYIKNLSITMDLFVIFQTVKIVLFRQGAR